MRATIWIAAALALVPAAAAAQPQRIEGRGTIPHAAAGTGFPEQIGDFRRVSVMRYDANGTDISGSYALRTSGGSLLITVYVYPATSVGAADRVDSCRREFSGVVEVIGQQYKDVQTLDSEPPPALAGADPALSHRGVFRFEAPINNQTQPVRSEARLYCYVGGDWLLKFRATSTLGFDPTEAIERFVQASPRPGVMPAAD